VEFSNLSRVGVRVAAAFGVVVPVARGRSDCVSSVTMASLASAREAFEKGDYHHCLSLLDELKASTADIAEQASNTTVQHTVGATEGLRGLALLRLGEADTAVATFEAVLAETPQDATCLAGLKAAKMVQMVDRMGTANELFKRDRLSEALDIYETIDEAALNEVHIYGFVNNKGALFMRLGRYADALRCFERALEVQPGSLEAAYNKGISLRSLGRNEQALQAFSVVTDQEPEHYAGLCGTADAQTALDMLEEAEASATKALQAQPNERRAYMIRAMVRLRVSNFLGAISDLEDAQRLGYEGKEFDEAYSIANSLQGDVLLKENQYAEARKYYEKALVHGDSDNPHINLLFHLAFTDLALGNTEEAEKGMRQVLSIDPHFYSANATFGTHLAKSAKVGSPEAREAVACLTKASAAKPMSNAEVEFHLGVAHVKLEEFEKAANAFHKAIEVDPNHQGARDAITVVEGQLALNVVSSKSFEVPEEAKVEEPPPTRPRRANGVLPPRMRHLKNEELRLFSIDSSASETPTTDDESLEVSRWEPTYLGRKAADVTQLSCLSPSPSSVLQVSKRNSWKINMKRMESFTRASSINSLPCDDDDSKHEVKLGECPVEALPRLAGAPLLTMAFDLEELQWPGPYPSGVMVEVRRSRTAAIPDFRSFVGSPRTLATASREVSVR